MLTNAPVSDDYSIDRSRNFHSEDFVQYLYNETDLPKVLAIK